MMDNFKLFHRFLPQVDTHSPTDDFYVLLTKMRQAVEAGKGYWGAYQNIKDYAEICFWAIRKQEYDFVIQAVHLLEIESGKPLRILDAGCGVVPLNNWLSARGHEVVAFDPLVADMQFVVGNDLNQFYDSSVLYVVAQGENMPFPNDYFDVVIAASVMEHVVPGNDRIMLWDLGRVLKPGGTLLATMDIAPIRADDKRAIYRQAASPFTYLSLTRLSRFISTLFVIEHDVIPLSLSQLTWDEVFDFWRNAQEHDRREQDIRQYLAVGMQMRKRGDAEMPSTTDIVLAYQEGQSALSMQGHHLQHHADERLKLLEENTIQIENLHHTIDETIVAKDQLEQDLQRKINTRDKQIGDAQKKIEGKEVTIAEKQRAILVLREKLKEKYQQYHQALQEIEQSTSRMVAMGGQLVDKEKEIQNFKTSAVHWLVHAPLSRYKLYQRLVNAVLLWKARVSPKLGVLAQYAPRPMHIPKRYKKLPNYAGVNGMRVSIVTPSFNQVDFLERTIRSVQMQQYGHLEYIVQDGGSDEDVRKIIERYPDVITQFESKADKGQANAINLGFKKSSGEIMAYLNSDDVLLPGTLNYITSFFMRHPEVDVVYGHRIIIDEFDDEIGRWVLPPHDENMLYYADYVPQETLFWRRGIWEEIGGEVDESFRFAMDWDMLVKFSQAGAKFARLPRFLAAFRVHAAQKTTAEMESVGMLEMDRVREEYHQRPVSREEIEENIKGYLARSIREFWLWKLGIKRY